MSVDKHPFRFVLPLTHMANVKIIQLLWRLCGTKELIKKRYKGAYPDKQRTHWRPLSDSMRWKLRIAVDKLPIPKANKIDLKIALKSMADRALEWLHQTAQDSASAYLGNNWPETISYLVDNVCWTNFGEVNPRAMFESYVSNKVTIDFGIWNQLCIYCIEDQIMKFAETIDWDYCKQCVSSHYPIYWYWKIYGKLPEEDMFKPTYYSYFDKCRREGMYDEKNIVRTMLKCSLCDDQINRANSSAVMYFGDHLKKKEEFSELVVNAFSSYPRPVKIDVPVLGRMEKDTLLESSIASYSAIIDPLMEWPLIQFMDDWLSVFETLEADSFTRFLRDMPGLHFLPLSDEERDKIHKRNFYEPFIKLWRVFQKKFPISEDDITMDAFWSLFKREDPVLCNLVFEEVNDQQRKCLLELLDDLFLEGEETLSYTFALQFSEKVLKDDRERESFWSTCEDYTY